MREKKKHLRIQNWQRHVLLQGENYSLPVNVPRSKTSLLLKFFIGYLINKEITEACIRIAMLITISEEKKNVFFKQKGKKYFYCICNKTKLQLFKP